MQIANSLSAHAAAIAVRIHAGKREVQVVDNGIGIPQDILEHIAEYEGDRQRVCEPLPVSNYLADVRRLSDRLTVASRHQDSEGTFMKVFIIVNFLLSYLTIYIKNSKSSKNNKSIKML